MRLSVTNRTLSYAVAALLAIAPVTGAWALDASHFASSSKLASGTWVKVEVPTDGVYEITATELAEMGFSDISKVKMFGRPAELMSESIDAAEFDDLVQIPTATYGEKLCFYGGSSFTRDVSTYYSMPFIGQDINTYTSSSYYFLTDDDTYSVSTVETGSSSTTATDAVTTSYGYLHHEKELCSPGLTGKALLGEDFGTKNEVTFQFSLPNYVPDSKIGIYTTVSAKGTGISYFYAWLNGTQVTLATNSNRISSTTSEYIYYYSASGRGNVTPDTVYADDTFEYDLTLECAGTLTMAKLNYATFTYLQYNKLATDSGQIEIYLPSVATTDKIVVDGATSDAVAWSISDDGTPTQYTMTVASDTAYFAPGFDSTEGRFFVFDPTRTLRKIASYESVANQNLHGMDTPHMVIITQPGLKEQAQRIADWHSANDGMDVAVIEQQAIFNEFSMGAPDAMAIRLFSKMLYSRDSTKYGYLLMFGGGTYDNRHLIGTRSENLLITYQSNLSYDETRSYTTDNFFGMLGDGTGTVIATIPVTISVGRIPAKTEEDAQIAVDKMLAYVSNSDYGDWQNRALLIADEGDDDVHMYQAEGIERLIPDSTAYNPVYAKVYCEVYPLTDDGFSVEGRNHITTELKRGALYGTYIGHGSHKALTKTAQVWRIEDAKSVTYDYLPFMTFASCDVARFDSDERGIAEEMFFKEGGGVVACMASARTVYVTDNDLLNTEFTQGVFTLNSDGSARSIGDAYADGQRSFGTANNINKLNFQLLGDPAMKLNFPRNLAKVTSIAGTTVTDDSTTVGVYPMTTITVCGEVYGLDGNIDTDYNGELTLSLYDKEILYKTIQTYTPYYDSYHQRDFLSKGNGTVTAGVFEVDITVPAECLASEETGLLSVYAYSSDKGYAVGGQSESILIKDYNDSVAISDTTPPVVEEMYLNDESFTNGESVLADPMLHITITDDVGVCSQTSAIANALSLVLDNGATSYSDARNIVNLTESGKKATIDIELSDLSVGKHSLTLQVSDLAGNYTARTIDFFIISSTAQATMTVDSPDVRDSATFTIEHDLTGTATATIFVLNGSGETVWKGTTTGTTCSWDLNDTSGNRVPSGLYRYYCILASDAQCASTPQQKLIVLAAK